MPDPNTRDHLANERTFLAWVRTCIALMGFGVVIARLRFLEGVTRAHDGTRSTLLGMAFVALGLLLLLSAAAQYQRSRRAIETGGYRPAHRRVYAFAAVLFVLGLVSVVYLFSLR